MEIKKALKTYKRKIDLELKIFLDKKVKQVRGISPHATEMMNHLREYILRGGKRIRPTMVVFGYKSAGGKKEKDIIKAAMAVEIMQAFLLMHDDIIDNDDMRRGYLTMHKVYESKFRRNFKSGDAEGFGKAMAIIGGDILSILGTESILHTNFSHKKKLSAIDKFNKVVINTCFGQILDVRSEICDDLSEKDLYRVHELKTAIYTIEGPLHIGAILGGASKKQLDQITKFSIPLGQAFQIQDDILGLFGDEKKLGKPIGSDLREGKKTFLILDALKKSNPKQKTIIKKALGKRDIRRKDIENVRQVIKDTGSLNHSQELALSLIKNAKKIVISSSLKKEGKEFLLGIADYILQRKY